MIYLDQAATSLQKPPSVAAAVVWAMEHCASLGRSGHEAAILAAETAYYCREVAGELFEAAPEQVVFTSNATHALNIAIHTMVAPGDAVVVSGFEHNAVMRPLHQRKCKITVAGTKLFDRQEAIEAFSHAVQPGVKAVICTHVSNVFGYILPIAEIAEICQERGIPLIIDASQSAGVLPVSLKKTGAAFIAMPGHKGLYGPQGTGLLLCGRQPKPLICGGTGSNSLQMVMPEILPDGAEAGTHNVPGIAGLGAGLQYVREVGVENIRQKENTRLSELHHLLEKERSVHQYFAGDPVQTGVLSVQIADFDCETAAQLLADRGIAVRSGLHCAPAAHRSAGSLDTGTIRVSVSDFTTSAEIRLFAEALMEIAAA